MTSFFTSPAPLQTAVLFLVFNRPDTTALVFQAIRKAKPPRLYVASDGPRDGREGEAERVAKVREIATAVDWPCEVKTLFREKNLGCGTAVREAIDWFFDEEIEGIILEDDTVPTQSFFSFCQELLRRYRLDSRVGAIAGTNHFGYKPENASYLFSKNQTCWGWATWKRAWANHSPDLKWAASSQRKDVLQNISSSKSGLDFWLSALDSVQTGKVDTWDWQWFLTIAAQNQLTIFPEVNMVANVGFGIEATHTKGKAPKSVLETSEIADNLLHPTYICPDRKFDELYERKKRSKRTLPRRVLSVIRQFLFCR